MSRPFTEAYLYGWRPGSGNTNNVRHADYVFKGEDVEYVSLSERAGDLKDTATVRVDNPGGKYTDSEAATVLQHGDRVEFQTRRGRELKGYGTGLYGDGLYQPDLDVRWTGIVRNISIDAEGRDLYSIEFDAEDYAYAVMSMRRVTNAWTDEQIVTGPGSGQGIINTILENECPELDLSALPSYPDQTTISLGDVNVLEAIVSLVNRLECILWASGSTVHCSKPEDIATKFTMDADDYTLWSYTSNDDQLFNRVRVEGGRSHEVDPVAQQTTHDAWTTVTKDSRLTRQITARKGEVDRIELWTDPTRTGADEELVVRLQKDDGGVPVAPDDTKSDIARKKLSDEFLATGGWTTFVLPQHNLPDPSPWVIVESSGSTGLDVGVRASDGVLAYITHYPYDIRTRRDNQDSQEAYRLREDTITDASLTDLSAARDAGSARLHRRSEPSIEFNFDAASDRLHEATPGDVVRVPMESVDVDGRFVVMDRSVEWQGSMEVASVTVRDIATL